MTKVTYYMYSFDICFMIREMMEMDDLDYAKSKIKKKDKWN